MRRRPMHHRVLLTLLIATFFAACVAAQVAITEFPVSTVGSGPAGITVGPDGNLWFTENNTNRVGRMTTTGAITEFSLNPNSFPADIVTGPDGNLWICEALKIARMAVNGSFIEFTVSGSGLSGMAVGPDGNLWFADFGTNKIGRISTVGLITEFSIPTPASQPSAVTAGPDGNVWFTELVGNKVGKITPSGVITEFAIPTPVARPTGIVAGPDGNLWFAENLVSKIGRISTTGLITEFSTPTPASNPSSVTAGPDGNVWFTESSGNKIGRITPSGAITEFAIPTPAARPATIVTGPDGSLWFTELQGNKIGRITTACSDDATSVCLNNKRFRVSASWQSASSSGQGTAVRLTNESGYFWFFSPGNVEVLIKVLNGCQTNVRYWAFVSGLTNVEVTLTVTDTLNNTVKTYVNPLNTNFQVVLDTGAFATCP